MSERVFRVVVGHQPRRDELTSTGCVTPALLQLDMTEHVLNAEMPFTLRVVRKLSMLPSPDCSFMDVMK